MRLTRPAPCINTLCKHTFPSMPVLNAPAFGTSEDVPGRCPLCRCVTMLELVPAQPPDEALIEDCKTVVQQKLDLDDLCKRCGHPLDDCTCPESAPHPHRQDAQPPPGRHGTWTCPYCDHLNTELNRYCQECGELYGEALS